MDSRVLSRRLMTVGGTFLCALSLGYFMQATARSGSPIEGIPTTLGTSNSGISAPSRVGSEDAAWITPQKQEPSTTSLLSDQGTSNMRWTSAEAVQLSEAHAPLYSSVPAAKPDVMITKSGLAPNVGAKRVLVPECDVRLSARKSLAAMVRLTLQAECLPHTSFTVHHNGMMFSDATDKAGYWEKDIPALAEQALFIVAFTSGESAITSTFVDTIPLYHRYVLQWQGDNGLELHALEQDAEYGAFGHVWSGAARDVSAAVHGEGGFITTLGSADGLQDVMRHKVQVYTVASSSKFELPDLRIQAEAIVDEANCGREIDAQVFSQQARFGLLARDLTFSMPDCSAIGDTVVLNDLDPGITIAAQN
ncbi:MAG: hypothetical protein AAF922_02600 [Pseudomonadota bacterium]